MKIAHKLYEGESAPWGYGFAWRCYSEMAIVVYPIPLNILARWIREAYFWLARPREVWSDKYYIQGYEMGQKESEKRHQAKIDALNAEWNLTVGLAILNERGK